MVKKYIHRATHHINPWKPVPKKKQAPKILSLIVKDDTLYSNPWKPVKITANIIVTIEPYKAPLLLPWIKEWWAYVTVAPLDNNIQL